MTEFLNQHSAVLLTVIVMLIVVALGLKYLNHGWTLVIFIITVGSLVIGFMQLSTGSSSVASATSLDEQLGNGTPALVEIYSDL